MGLLDRWDKNNQAAFEKSQETGDWYPPPRMVRPPIPFMLVWVALVVVAVAVQSWWARIIVWTFWLCAAVVVYRRGRR